MRADVANEVVLPRRMLWASQIGALMVNVSVAPGPDVVLSAESVRVLNRLAAFDSALDALTGLLEVESSTLTKSLVVTIA